MQLDDFLLFAAVGVCLARFDTIVVGEALDRLVLGTLDTTRRQHAQQHRHNRQHNNVQIHFGLFIFILMNLIVEKRRPFIATDEIRLTLIIHGWLSFKTSKVK